MHRTYVGGLGDYDQGTHLLIGEDKFRGRHRCTSFCSSFHRACTRADSARDGSVTAVMTSMKHACFLRDPRTEVVVGEPRADLSIVPKLKLFLPQELNRVGVSSTIFDVIGQLTGSLCRSSNSRTRDRCTSFSDVIDFSRPLRCTRAKKSRFRKSLGPPIS